MPSIPVVLGRSFLGSLRLGDGRRDLGGIRSLIELNRHR